MAQTRVIHALSIGLTDPLIQMSVEPVTQNLKKKKKLSMEADFALTHGFALIKVSYPNFRVNLGS